MDESGRNAFRITSAFLEGRLEERQTIDWALGLGQQDTAKRLAVLDYLDRRGSSDIAEPWRSAWRTISESWSQPIDVERDSIGKFRIQERIRGDDLAGGLEEEITRLVAPRLKVKPFSKIHLQYRKLPKTPKQVSDLFSTSISSGETIDPQELMIPEISSTSFLQALANSLDHAVNQGLDLAKRMGHDSSREFWRLGEIRRVYFVQGVSAGPDNHEPDRFHTGLAPSVKLLHAVVSRLQEIDSQYALGFVSRWKSLADPIHRRLVATMYVSREVASPKTVFLYLRSLTNVEFWDINVFPEIAELRAVRFGDLVESQQEQIESKLRKLPPRSIWPIKVERERVESARHYWAARELLRIRAVSDVISEESQLWLNERLSDFPELANGVSLHFDFLDSPRVRSVPSTPDQTYDSLKGKERLKLLEANLRKARHHWDDDPAKGAEDWVMISSNANLLIEDFEEVDELASSDYSAIWERFGWAHRPESISQEEAALIVRRVLGLIATLSETTLSKSIAGLSNWLSAWEQFLSADEGLAEVWHKLWPFAVIATNDTNEGEVEERTQLSSVLDDADGTELQELDTLNPPAGKLVGVFLSCCPNLEQDPNPFSSDGVLWTLRETIVSSTGRARSIGIHRMIESLAYFLRADSVWANTHLVSPLFAEDEDSLVLWKAIARRMHRRDTLEIIGNVMASRATDPRFSRNTRQAFVFNLIVDSLHAIRDKSDPAVPVARIQQMIRSLDPEVRSHAANTMQRYVSDMAASGDADDLAPDALFRSAVLPFLKDVWPPDRSLAGPGISRAFADLPATVLEEFVNAVDAIKAFVVPFDCWSLLEFGLYTPSDAETPKLDIIDTTEKAKALLELLDLSIGTADGSVVPHDLSDALTRIENVAPTLRKSPRYRRLATAARRT